ncbi:MAG: penicillin-binding transpeptidase domain-containing protein, partial [Gammaproteobacteria bacterium]
AGVGLVDLPFVGMEWARSSLGDASFGPTPNGVDDVLQPGAVIRVAQTPTTETWGLAQIPQAQAAFVAMDPQDGAVVALVGGFDFYASKYNRATQARRQPGSSFKPFVYSAALENGFTQASIIADSPVVFDSKELETVWRPENYARGFGGDMMLREALIKSKNLVSVRVVLKAGLGSTIRHIREFGFDDQALPVNPSLALGAGNLTPLDLTRGYATFANGGYRVDNYIIQRIENAAGEVVFEADPMMVCVACDVDSTLLADTPEELATDPFDLYPATQPAARVITPQNAYLMNDMMRKVVTRGTGIGAYRALGREDIGGKTGTSNDQRDAWFAGFNSDLVAISWVGFDQERSLGAGEQGGRTALPAWNYFMAEALTARAENTMPRPPGLVDVRINPRNGLVAAASCPQSQFVTFRIGKVPPRDEESCFEIRFKPEPLPLPDGEDVLPEPTETTEPDDGRLF